jgi:hypothetical protein
MPFVSQTGRFHVRVVFLYEPRIPLVCVLLAPATDEKNRKLERQLLLGMMRSHCSRMPRCERSVLSLYR